MDNAKETTKEPENIAVETIQSETKTEKKILKKKNEQSINDLWDNIKQYGICATEDPEGEEKQKWDTQNIHI